LKQGEIGLNSVVSSVSK